MIKQLVYHLAFLLYKLRNLFLHLIVGRGLTYHFQRSMNKERAIARSMGIIVFDLFIIIEVVGAFSGFSINFESAFWISALITLLIYFFVFSRDDYFKKTFVPRQEVLPLSQRFFFYVLAILLFVVIPGLIALCLYLE